MYQSFKKLWPFIRPIKSQVFLALFLGFCYALVQSLLPLLAKTLIAAFEVLGSSDQEAQKEFMQTVGLMNVPDFIPFIGGESLSLPFLSSFREKSVMDLLVAISMVFPIYYFIMGLLRYSHFFLVKFVGEQVISDVRLSLMSKFLELDVLYLGRQKKGSGGVLSRTLNDTLVLQNGLQYYGDLVREPILGLFIFIMMLFINWQLTLGCLVFLPVFALVIRYVD